MKRDLLHALLYDVRFTGSAQIHKKKLLWLLGRKNEGASAWSLLLDEWVEAGGGRDELYGTWYGEYITLVFQSVDQISSKWAA